MMKASLMRCPQSNPGGSVLRGIFCFRAYIVSAKKEPPSFAQDGGFDFVGIRPFRG